MRLCRKSRARFIVSVKLLICEIDRLHVAARYMAESDMVALRPADQRVSGSCLPRLGFRSYADAAWSETRTLSKITCPTQASPSLTSRDPAGR